MLFRVDIPLEALLYLGKHIEDQSLSYLGKYIEEEKLCFAYAKKYFIPSI